MSAIKAKTTLAVTRRCCPIPICGPLAFVGAFDSKVGRSHGRSRHSCMRFDNTTRGSHFMEKGPRFFDFLDLAARKPKPRRQGLTCIGDEGDPIAWVSAMLETW